MREAFEGANEAGSHSRGAGETLAGESLLFMTRPEIEAAYAGGSVPESLEELQGSARGFVPLVMGVDRTPLAGLVQRVASAEAFPWQGKSFESAGVSQSEGANQIRPLGRVAPFTATIEPSAIDGAPCVYLDYERPENPWPIRKIRDEIREISPGLFLGPAMLELGGRRIVLLYFALAFS